jgi:hypothetical protein
MYIEINDGLIENVNRWALQRGLSLTADRDFLKFKSLQVRNPFI